MPAEDEMHILIVEDEPSLREGLHELLDAHGHDVISLGTAELAWDQLQSARNGESCGIDLILLDWMLPGMDGRALCRQVRAANLEVGVLMLTARGSEEDKVTGLREGADDYLTKPFGMNELLARIDSLARRLPQSSRALQLEIDGCDLDLGRCQAIRNGIEQSLTAREAAILRLLWKHRDRAVGRDELLEKVWSAPGDLQTRTVDMAIVKLRQKIERDASRPKIVVTMKGIGYAWGAKA
jgi:two-component system, OmpR family, alkaline phosphatase synthesis response regulator PhoP